MSNLSPRLLKNTQAEFVRGTLADATDPGVEPFGTEVLILMDQCAVKSTGGIIVPEEVSAKMNVASESGVVVDLGEAAFRYYGDGTPWTGRKPSIGDRVFVERYAGREILGRDGNSYRLMTFTCVGGREKPLAQPAVVGKQKKG